MGQKLWCVGFEEFKEIALLNGWNKEVPKNISIISINNGEDAGSDEEYHVCEGTNVLNLDFDDVDPIALGLDNNAETFTYQSCIGNIINLEFFTRDMANTSVMFISEHIDNDFYIHCSAGVSRSQAFVKYIKNVYPEIEWETNPNNPCIVPNGLVFQKLMQSYRNNLN